MFHLLKPCSIDLPSCSSLFSIFRIYPDDEDPVLLKIAETDSDIMTFDYSLLGNKLIYLQGPTLNVWDFKEDAWACIEVPDDIEHAGLLTK